MTELELRLLVEGFDVENDSQVGTLHEYFDATAAGIAGLLTIVVRVPGRGDSLAAAKVVVRDLERHVSGLRVVDLDLDLVDVGEIADRTGKTRQAINLLATGKRGQRFPDPYALPGGHRVWTWASVNRWLAEHRPDWADPIAHLTRAEQRRLAAWLATRPSDTASGRGSIRWHIAAKHSDTEFADLVGAQFHVAEVAHDLRAAETVGAQTTRRSVRGRFVPRVTGSAAAS